MESIQYKNVEIAKMLGAVEEQWYPYNKDTKTTGIYLVFPTELYRVDDNSYRWYPDNCRQHSDALLKFNTDANWQLEAIGWIENRGYMTNIHNNDMSIIPKIRPFEGLFPPHQYLSKKEAIFERLFQFSKFLKR